MFISIQGPAIRTYNRVSTILSGLWTKLHSYPAIEVSMNVLVACSKWNISEKCVFLRNICWFVWNSAQNGGRHWFLLSPLVYSSKFLRIALNTSKWDIRRRQQIVRQSLHRSLIELTKMRCCAKQTSVFFSACSRTVTLVGNISMCAYVWNLCNKQDSEPIKSRIINKQYLFCYCNIFFLGWIKSILVSLLFAASMMWLPFKMYNLKWGRIHSMCSMYIKCCAVHVFVL